MEKAKKVLGLVVAAAVVAAMIYVPLSYHFVKYEGDLHTVRKEKLSFSHTYLSLEKRRPEGWDVVLKSRTLRAYFMKKLGKDLFGKFKGFGAKARKRLEGLLRKN